MIPRFRIAPASAALGLALSALVLPALAAEGPVAERQALMKQVGGAMKTLGGTAKGAVAYDAAAVKAAFMSMHEAAAAFGKHFPEGSEAADSEASPKIWTDREGFDAALAKFQTDTTKAVEAAPADKDAFMPVFGQVASNCKACHEAYRVKK